MRNLKFVIFSAVSGFVLSLFFGIFSHSGFFRVFLTALIVAVVFAALGFGISLLYSKFLVVDSSDSDYALSGKSGSSNAASGNGASGSIVDLVVQDEELIQTGNSNHYDVGNNHQMLNASDIKNQNSNDAAELMRKENISAASSDSLSSVASSLDRSMESGDDATNDNGFVPLRYKENYKNISGTEASGIGGSNIIRGSDDGSGSGGLDVLPDMGDMSLSSGNSSTGSGFSSFDGDSVDNSFVKSISSDREEPVAEIKDSALMAKAISSILADES